MTTRLKTVFTVVVGMALVSGCGEVEDRLARTTVPVTGVVKFKGKVIPDATICLHPVDAPADGKPVFTPRGNSDEAGNYTLTTYRTADGAPVGEYNVTVSWLGPLKGLDEDQEDRLRERLPRRYTKPETSGIKVVVSDGQNQLDDILLK